MKVSIYVYQIGFHGGLLFPEIKRFKIAELENMSYIKQSEWREYLFKEYLPKVRDEFRLSGNDLRKLRFKVSTHGHSGIVFFPLNKEGEYVKGSLNEMGRVF